MFLAWLRASSSNPLNTSQSPSPRQRLRAAHLSAEHHGGPGGRYVGDVVLGGLDGIVTSFAVVSGAAGAQLGLEVVPILGLATLIADGLSMSASAYLSAKSQREFYKEQERREYAEVEAIPDVERTELYDIYLGRGYSEESAKRMVDILAEDKHRWVKAMLVEELGLLEDERRPGLTALAVFTAFVIAGMAPLLVYLVSLVIPMPPMVTFSTAVALSAAALFILGAAKVLITKRNPLRAGLEMLVVGTLAGGAAYVIGYALNLLLRV